MQMQQVDSGKMLFQPVARSLSTQTFPFRSGSEEVQGLWARLGGRGEHRFDPGPTLLGSISQNLDLMTSFPLGGAKSSCHHGGAALGGIE